MLTALQLAIKNVYRKRERSLLTIVGVLLAVGSFISLLSIAEGISQRIHREVNDRYVDVYVMPGDAVSLPTGPLGTVGFSSEILPIDLVKDLSNDENVSRVCPVYRIQEKIAGQTVVIWGINPEDFRAFFPFLNLKQNGRLYSGNSKEIIVGGALAAEKGINIQTPIVIEGQPFETVGLGVTLGAFQDYFCFISLENAMNLKSARGYQEIWLQIKGKTKADRQNIAAQLKNKYPNLNIKSREDYLGSANEYVNYAWLLEFAIAAIGVLIATTASMNTMLMSTYERIKEFGTLRSIGASRFIVFNMILMESLILSFIGGAGGVLLGVMGSRVLDEGVKFLLQLSFPLASVTMPLVAYAILLSTFIGLAGAVIPAVIVYRMNIIKALRWE